MNVWRYNDSTEAPALILEQAAKPKPQIGELLVRIHAAGVTPSELRWYPTTHDLAGAPRRGAIPGHEFSGIVEEVGPEVNPELLGRAVFGMNNWFWEGATAEYCLTVPGSVTGKPATLSHVEAASVPIGALTAWQGLIDRAKLSTGERVLIHGGSGAVGIYCIQLAKRAGAHVITTASSRTFDYLANLGADEMIDYKSERFEEKVRNVDVVFDAVGGETLARSWEILKPNGRMITISADSEGTKDQRIEKAFFIVEPNHHILTEVAQLLSAGHLHCQVNTVIPFAEASLAYTGQLPARKGRGKVVIAVGENLKG